MDTTWSEAVNAWVLELRATGRPDTTITTRTCHIRRLGRHHAGVSPWSLTRSDLIEWLAIHSWAAETRRCVRSSIRNFYGWAHDTGRIVNNPAAKLPASKPGQPDPRPVPHSDYLQALMAATPRERLMLRLGAEAGLRRSEIAQVHSRDIKTRVIGGDVVEYTLIVHGKGSKLRDTPLNAALARDLLALEPGWVFPGNYGGHISPAWAGKIVARLLPEGFTMHKLRHKCASDVYTLTNGQLLVVKEMLGHASVQTTLAYVKRPDAAVRAAADALGELRYQEAA